MANIVFSNNASALLATSIIPADLTVQVAAGYGALFPSPGAGEYFFATLEDNAGNIEVVQCTSRATDILTVVRAQEGTLAQSFTLTVTRVELRLTKATMEEMFQVSGGTLTGTVDFNGNSLLDPIISGPLTKFTQGQIAGVPLRGAVDLTTNEIAVPAGGGRATAGAAIILAQGDDIVAELDTAGVIILNSATVGVRVPSGAYLRVEGPTPANHMSVIHNDTILSFTFPNTTSVGWDTLLNMSANIDMQDNQILQAMLVDYSILVQTVSGVATTNLDWALGPYVKLNLTANIGSLTFSNLPAGFASFRLKITQDATPRTIAWPTGTIFAQGLALVLTVTSGAVDYVDLWTDDGGTTWNAILNPDWKV
jgi:hypothetical protein